MDCDSVYLINRKNNLRNNYALLKFECTAFQQGYPGDKQKCASVNGIADGFVQTVIL